MLPKLDKDINTLTTLEKERALKKLHGETNELIDEMGQDSDKKALPTVQQYVKEMQDEARKQHEDDVNMLITKSNNKVEYQRYLIKVMERHVKDEMIPKTYSLYVESNNEGLVLGISGTEYYGAFKVCGIPLYDLHACKALAVRLGNTVARMEGHFSQTEGGIALATSKEDLKFAVRKYGRKGNQSGAKKNIR